MTGMWLMLLALHVVGLVGYSLLLRKSLLDNVDRLTLATIMQTGIALPMVFFLFVAPPSFIDYDLKDILVILVAALLVVALHITNVKALQYLEASVYAILFNLRILFTTVLGIVLLGEAIVPLQIIGGLLIFAAVATVRQKGGKKLHVQGVRWGIAAAVVISLLNLSEKYIIAEVGFLNYAVPAMLLAAGILWGIMLARQKPIPLKTFIQPRMLQLMTLRSLSAYAAILAFSAGALLSVMTYISSLSVIVIVVLGVLLLGETDYLRQKIIATVMAALGLTAILLARLM